MPDENQTKQESDVVKYKTIGNTAFKIVSYYSEANTYTDVVKSVLRMEIEKEK